MSGFQEKLQTDRETDRQTDRWADRYLSSHTTFRVKKRKIKRYWSNKGQYK